MPATPLDYSPLPTPRTHRHDLLLLALILITATLLRSYHLGKRNLWVDELQTTLSASGTGLTALHSIPFDRIVSPAPQLIGPAAAPTLATLRPDRDDIHPPTYAFLTRCWANCFGWSETALRSLAVCFSVLGVYFLFGAVRDLSGPTPALYAAAIAALAQAHLDTGREARAYALLLTTATAATWAAARIITQGPTRRRTLTLAALCFALPLINYFGAFAVLALAAWALLSPLPPVLRGERVRVRGADSSEDASPTPALPTPSSSRGRQPAVAQPVEHAPAARSPRRALLLPTLLPLLTFALLWSPILYLQSHGASRHGTTFFLDDADGPHWLNTLWRLALLPQRYLNDPLPSTRPVAAFVWVAPLAAIFLFRRRPDLRLWALWLPINILPSLAIDSLQGSWSLGHLRYTILASLSLYALLPALVAQQRPLLRHGLPLLVLFGCALALYPNVYNPRATDNRALGQAAAAFQQPGDLVVLHSDAYPTGMPLRYLMALQYYGPQTPAALLILTTPTPDLATQLRQYNHVLLISDGLDPATLSPTARITSTITFIPGFAQVERLTLHE